MTRVDPAELTPRDAWFLYNDEITPSDAPSLITDFYVFDAGQARVTISTHDAAAAWLAPRLDHTPHLRRRLHRVPTLLGYPRWVDADAVDLDHHLRVRPVGPTTRIDFHRLLAEVSTSVLDPMRPLWQLHVLTDVRGVTDLPERACVVALHYHHAFADGQHGAALARALFDESDTTAGTVTATESKSGALRAVLALPWQFAGLGSALIASARARRKLHALVAAGTVVPPRVDRPTTRFNGPQNHRREFGRVRLDLNEVRALARATGTTVNDVVLTIVGGGLARYLGASPSSLAAQVPYSTRTRSDTGAANQTTTMYVDLHTDETDPRARLRRVHASSVAEKDRVTRPETQAIESTLDHAPALYRKAALRRGHRIRSRNGGSRVTVANTTVSNVPHGPATLRFGDAPVTDAFTIPAIHEGSGLGHFVVSLGDALTLTSIADNAVMPDAEAYTDALTAAYRELRATLTGLPIS